jgi:N-acyl amino acid synthase of PEP-CTERM/exosortase system
MLLTEMFNLDANFKKYFEVVPATTERLREEAYRIRHDVYCEELEYETARGDGLETDRFDAHALHCLLRHVPNGDYVGCVRLVLVPPGQEGFLLPMEDVCKETLNRALFDPLRKDAAHVAEVSRLAVRAKYRRRKSDAGGPVAISEEDYGGKGEPRFPYIPVGLYLGMIRLAEHAAIRTLFVLTQERLARHLARLGVHTHPIGGEVEHRGPRVPATLDVATVVGGFNRFVRPLYAVIAADVDRGLAATGAQMR